MTCPGSSCSTSDNPPPEVQSSTEALFPHALEKWFGISGNWALSFGGLALLVTLPLNPEGIAGANYRRKRQRIAAGRPPWYGAVWSRLQGRETTARSEPSE